MKKVYIILDEINEQVHKIFSSKKFADIYLTQVPDELIYKLSEPQEFIVEQ